MRLFGKALTVCIALILVGAIGCGCHTSPSSVRNTNNNPAHAKEFYEGWWACCGYKLDGDLVSFDSLSPEEKQDFPYLDMSLDAGQLASVNKTENGSGESKMLLFGEWEATATGITIDGAEFTLEGERLTAQQGNDKLYFEKCVSDNELHVDTVTFYDISFDAPIDLAYIHNGISPESDRYRVVNSDRMWGPSLNMVARDTDAQDITELTDEFAGYEDSFTSFNGINYVVDILGDGGTTVDFIANGKWYTILFSHFGEDPVDYSDYATTFYTTIRIGGDAIETEPAQSMPQDAIPWEDASLHIGESASVYGPVVGSTYASTSNGQPTFIDIGAKYPSENRVTVVIWGEARAAFPQPPETMYSGKTVCVTGVLYEYGSTCNIEVTSPSQITII